MSDNTIRATRPAELIRVNPAPFIMLTSRHPIRDPSEMISMQALLSRYALFDVVHMDDDRLKTRA